MMKRGKEGDSRETVLETKIKRSMSISSKESSRISRRKGERESDGGEEGELNRREMERRRTTELSPDEAEAEEGVGEGAVAFPLRISPRPLKASCWKERREGKLSSFKLGSERRGPNEQKELRTHSRVVYRIGLERVLLFGSPGHAEKQAKWRWWADDGEGSSRGSEEGRL